MISPVPDHPKQKNQPIRNVHGRRPGRGLRPYLIVMKILAVGTFLGGLVAVEVGLLLAPQPTGIEAWRSEADTLQRIYNFAILPGLATALAFGALLFASIWRVIIRMRWFMTKMVLIGLAVPALHVYLSTRVMGLESLLADSAPDLQRASELRGQIALGTAATIVFAVAAIILGRVKPRLGQDYGRTLARPAPPAP